MSVDVEESQTSMSQQIVLGPGAEQTPDAQQSLKFGSAIVTARASQRCNSYRGAGHASYAALRNLCGTPVVPVCGFTWKASCCPFNKPQIKRPSPLNTFNQLARAHLHAIEVLLLAAEPCERRGAARGCPGWLAGGLSVLF